MSGALDGNARSARVSEKLGYEPVEVGEVAPRGVPVREQRFQLERERWKGVEVEVEVEGLEPCQPLFGIAA